MICNATQLSAGLLAPFARMALEPSTPVAGVLNACGGFHRLAVSSQSARSEILLRNCASEVQLVGRILLGFLLVFDFSV